MARKPEKITTRKQKKIVEDAGKLVGEKRRELRDALDVGDDERAKRIRRDLQEILREITGG